MASIFAGGPGRGTGIFGQGGGLSGSTFNDLGGAVSDLLSRDRAARPLH